MWSSIAWNLGRTASGSGRAPASVPMNGIGRSPPSRAAGQVFTLTTASCRPLLAGSAATKTPGATKIRRRAIVISGAATNRHGSPPDLVAAEPPDSVLKGFLGVGAWGVYGFGLRELR